MTREKKYQEDDEKVGKKVTEHLRNYYHMKKKKVDSAVNLMTIYEDCKDINRKPSETE